MSRMRADGRSHAVSRLLALLACAIAVLGCAGTASAAPGLTPLSKPQIGLPTESQAGGAVAVHRGEVYSVVNELGPAAPPVLRVYRFDLAREAWLPVGGPLNSLGLELVGHPLAAPRVRVFMIAGPPGDRTITLGDELPDAEYGAPVEMAALPAPAAPGTLVLNYQTVLGHDSMRHRIAPMRYTP